MSTTFKIPLFFGLARDLYSTERGVVKGKVVEVVATSATVKSPPASPPHLKVQIAGGATVNVATTDTSGLAAGAEIDVTEMVMPWGQVWYKRRN